MAVRTITTRLALDGEAQFKNAMSSINGALRNLKSELALSEAQFKGQANTVAALTAKDKLLQQSLEQQKVKVKALAQAVVDAKTAYGENSAVTDRYRQQLARAQTDLINLNRELEENSQHLKEAQESADGTSGSIDEFGNATQQAGNSVTALAGALQAAGVAMALRQIAGAIRECVDASMEFETAMANLNKVAKLGETELAAMGEDIKQLSTELPATTSEIAQVAEASRRLGIAQEDLLSFTEVMVNLGGVSDLSADQAATALARFANIVGTASSDYERLGSTIVALGNNFATSESEITNMASRLAAAGKLAHLSEAQIMGLAAAMSSVGIEAEAGGTAMTQTLTAMEKAVTSGGKKLEDFARIAGMSSSQFADAWQREPITAIQAFIAGLGQLDSQGESATQVLEALGLSGIRQSNMLKSLALASETLTGTLSTAEQAWRENTELAETAAAKYDTTEAKMQMAANAANNLKIAVGDVLTPALGRMAEAGTNAFSWAADFVKDNEILVVAFTGLAAAAGVVAAGFTAYAAKAALATLATTGFGAALLATPIGPIAAAVGGLVSVFTLFANAAEDAKTANDALAESIQETRETLEKNVASAQESADSISAMAESVLKLADAENLSGVQHQAMMDLIQKLNAAIPGLNLAYDEQTGKLNMTAEAVRNLAAAEGDRLVLSEAAQKYNELYTQQTALVQQLEQAEVALAEAKAANAAARDAAAASGERETQAVRDATQAQLEAWEVTADLNTQIKSLQTAMDEIEAQYGDMSSAVEETEESLDAAIDAAEEAEAQSQALTQAMEEQEEATLYLAGAQDELTAALKEQKEAGSLSYETAQDLIEAGYGAALAIDNETGAVTLNQAEYIRLAGAKIQAQLATLEMQRAAADTARHLAEEEAAATDDANAFHKLAMTKAAAAHADDVQALDLQIAALNRSMSALNNYSFAAATASRRSRAASKQIKTQAQQDLEAYKAMKAELDHQKNMELVSEEDYYRQLGEYRDQYLLDESNASEYRKVTEQIHKYESEAAVNAFKSRKNDLDYLRSLDLVDERTYYELLAQYRNQYLTDENGLSEYRQVTEQIFEYDQSLAEQEAELWANQTTELIDELESRMKAAMDAQDKMASKLRDYGDLYTIEKDKENKKERMKLESLQEQINAIDAYEQALSKLQERGISGSLMEEILGMDVEYATQYANQLLSKSEQQWEQYNELWDEKQQRALEVAEKFFKEEIDSIENEYNQKLETAFDSLEETAFGSGEDTIQGMIDGLASMEPALYSKLQEISDHLNSFMSEMGMIPSNSELAANFSTERIAERFPGVTNRQMQSAVAGGVNGMISAMAGAATGGGEAEGAIYLDSQKVGRFLLPGLRTEAKATPEVKDDT